MAPVQRAFWRSARVAAGLRAATAFRLSPAEHGPAAWPSAAIRLRRTRMVIPAARSALPTPARSPRATAPAAAPSPLVLSLNRSAAAAAALLEVARRLFLAITAAAAAMAAQVPSLITAQLPQTMVERPALRATTSRGAAGM